MQIFENRAQLRKLQFEDAETLVVIYGAGVHIRDKRTKRHKLLRLVLKPTGDINTSGTLFRFLRLTLQAQAGTFERVITAPEVQSWFLEAAKNYLNTD